MQENIESILSVRSRIMGTLDIVSLRDKMLASLANYRLCKTTMEHVFEKEDLWNCIKSIDDKRIEAMSGSTTTTCGSRFATMTSKRLDNPTPIP